MKKNKKFYQSAQELKKKLSTQKDQPNLESISLQTITTHQLNCVKQSVTSSTEQKQQPQSQIEILPYGISGSSKK